MVVSSDRPRMPAEQLGVLLVDHGGQVAAVVEDHVQRLAVGEEQRLLDAPIELFVRSCPSRRRPGTPALAMAAAAWSCVEKMLQLLQVTSAPSSMQRLDQHGRLDRHVQAAGDARALSGFVWPYFSRSAIRPGISFSASMISLRPQSASEMSATLYGSFFWAGSVAVAIGANS